MESEIEENYETLSGQCPDIECNNVLYFFSTSTIITCSSCGQEHKKDSLLNVCMLDKKKDLAKMVKGYLANLGMPHKGTEFVKVNGLSNFQCKLISPLLTLYGMDKEGRPRLLTELGHGEMINCGKLIGNRTFHVATNHTNIEGYGKDRTGSLKYLEGFLDLLKEHHKGEELLIPLHADGDGHCLVHAVSRALIGRELFWHGLRKNLQSHLIAHLSDYKELFKEFHDEDEWTSLIDEADPFNCSGGITGGLGNIHIFALSNTLQRPIMLIDMPKNMQKVGDYSGLFVPVLSEPKSCLEKSPICIAWSGVAHNHFVPLVPILGKPLPTVPRELVPNVWGVSPEKACQYLDINEDGSITIGRGKPLKTSYLLKLVRAMESVFIQHYEVSSALVEDFYQFVYYPKKFLIQPYQMTTVTKTAFVDKRIRKCLDCKALQELPVSSTMLRPGGSLYNLVIECHQVPKTMKKYTFQTYKVVCIYDKEDDMLVVSNSECTICKRYQTRDVDIFGNILYHNGDATDNVTTVPTKCNCKYKHYWNGKEYDNLPESFTMTLEWGGTSHTAEILWFYGDSNPDLNSKPQVEAKRIVQEHFGSTGTEELVSQLTDCLEQKQNEFNKVVALCQEEASHNSELLDSIQEASKTATNKSDRPSTSTTPHTAGAENSPAVQSAFKRKSNGQPIVVDQTQCNQPKDSKVNVKISTCKGQKKTFKLQPQTSVKDLKALIHSCFHIPEQKQILKYGFPPRILDDSREIELKSGDQIKVEEKKDEGREGAEAKNSGSVAKPLAGKPLDPIASTTELYIKLEQLKRDFELSGSTSMWDFCCEIPQLFLPGGVFYQQFEIDIGLKHGSHCSFPLIPDKRFQFNEQHNRIELCLEPVGHFPVDNDILQVIKKFASANVDEEHAGKESRLGNDDANLVNSRLAPGYLTVGSQPANLSAEEIDNQRNELQKMVKQLSDEKK